LVILSLDLANPPAWLLVAPALLPLAGAGVLVALGRSPRLAGPIALIVLALALLADATLLRSVLLHGPASVTMGDWPPPFGISFAADTLGALFAVFAKLSAAAVAWAALGDEDARADQGFFVFLLVTVAGVSGAFLTGDVFNLYVWFEVFVIGSFGLVGLARTAEALDGAIKYAVLNLVGTTLFLIAIGLLYGAFGTLNMADIARKAPGVAQAGAPLGALALLFLLAFATKAAVFPLQFWLPASYPTATPLTAALFGGLLTKVGVYAMLKVVVMLMPAAGAEWSGLISAAACLTMLFGALGALAQDDLRRTAGFLVIAGVGTMLAGIATGDRTGLAGTVFYAVQSMAATSALFILVGAIGKAGGVSLQALGGLSHRSTLLAGCALVLALTIAGLPPGSGLWPKVLLVESSLAADRPYLTAAILASSLVLILALGRMFMLAFWRPAPPGAMAADRADERVTVTAPLAVLVSVGLVLGLWPEPFAQAAFSAADGLIDPSRLIDVVFPEGAAP
jgi:multicomponent Na+:H+ antiporter subunit D